MTAPTPIVFIEGFDTYDTVTNTVAGLFCRWSCAFSPQLSLVAAAGTDTGQQLNIAAGGGEEDVLAPIGYQLRTFTFGVQFTTPSLGGSTTGIFMMRDGGTRSLGIAMGSDGSLKAYSGNFTTLLGSSAAGVLTINTPTCIEFGCYIDDTVGTFDIWVGGVNVLHLTGIDTHVTTNLYVDTIEITESITNAKYDHVYVSDNVSSIATNQYFKVAALVPNADVSNTNFTPDTGTTLYTQVDTLLGSPGDTEYIQGLQPNDEFVIGFGNLSGGNAVLAVDVINVSKKDISNTRNIQIQTEQGGTKRLDGAVSAITTSYVERRTTFNKDANNASWTETLLNSAGFGAKLS